MIFNDTYNAVSCVLMDPKLSSLTIVPFLMSSLVRWKGDFEKKFFYHLAIVSYLDRDVSTVYCCSSSSDEARGRHTARLNTKKGRKKYSCPSIYFNS